MKKINLLPPHRLKTLLDEKRLYAIKVMFFYSIFSFVLVVLFQLGMVFEKNYRIQNLEKESENIKKELDVSENSNLKNRVKEINGIIQDFTDLSQINPNWPAVIAAFTQLPPEEVRINSFTVDALSGKININGFASSREKVIELYERIVADEVNFHDVDYPLENISKPEDINFHFSFFADPKLVGLPENSPFLTKKSDK